MACCRCALTVRSRGTLRRQAGYAPLTSNVRAHMPHPSTLLPVIAWLIASALIGVTGATSLTCGVGLAMGTDTWCGLGWFWLIGWPFAVVISVVLGLPIYFLFRWLGLHSWWHFAIGGVLLAAPLWYELAQPFQSPRWQVAGAFDTLNYLGSGLLGGLVFWWAVFRARCNNAL